MGGKVRSKGKKQNKVIIILLAPFKVLGKAGKFYMKFIQDCSDVGQDYNALGGGHTTQLSSLSKNYSVNSASASGRRSGPIGSSTSGRRSGPLESSSSSSGRRSSEMQAAMQIYRQAEARRGTMGYPNGMGIRSSSVGMRKIGKIDEEKPLSFREEEEDDNKADHMYPRSRSHAVRNVGFY